MRYTLSIILLFLFGTVGTLKGQSFRTFTPDPQTYFNQLKEFMGDMDDVNSDSIASMMLRFEPIWTEFTDENRRFMYELSNQMLRKRMVRIAEWDNMLNLVMYLHQNAGPETFTAWIRNLSEYVRTETNRTSADYLHLLRGALIEDVMFAKRMFWQARNGDRAFSMESEPVITYTAIDLVGINRNDSTLIEMTSGLYYPQRELFVGNGGMVYWTRAGLSADTLYAELDKYEIQLDQTSFEADSVTLYSKLYVKKPVRGHLTERLTSSADESRTTFPRFVAYDRLEIKDFLPGVDYRGAFSVVGPNFYASDVAPLKAQLKFRYEDRYQVALRSSNFLLNPRLISSNDVEVCIYLGESDSIYHPKSAMKYVLEHKQLSISRDKEGLSLAPYSDTYHDLDIYMDQITWTTTSPRMMLQNLNLGTETPLVLESKNYYRGERLQAIQGLSSVHPLYRIKTVTDARDTTRITLSQMAAGLGMTELHTSRFMMEMSIMGFVDYDLNTGWIIVKDKLFEYLLNSEGERDYDVIRFVSSVSQGSNAAVSLLNYDMEIVGIAGIALSDSQQVHMYPAGRKIVVHEDLDFDFDGRIEAGRFSFWGQKFAFDYDQFRVGMANIDSMRFKVESFDQPELGNKVELVNVKNTLQDISGELLIDKPNNKSGRAWYTEYPIFKSSKGSYVYYDNPTIYNGAYGRDEFYVELDPFEIDSLDNITTDGLKFGGVFVSGGIFPEMRQDVMVQEDYSLGFKMTTPPGGLTAYGGKGLATTNLTLSNKGLVGEGRIDYLQSVAESDAFTFFPDSTIGVARTYEIAEKIGGAGSYPHVTAEDIRVSWQPYRDFMRVSSQDNPFQMYDALGMTAKGHLDYGTAGLKGGGQLDFLDAQTQSQDYTFLNRSFSSTGMDFRVRKDPAADWGFAMKDARGDVNFDRGMGDFTLNGGDDEMRFPINKYVTHMDHADWVIAAKTVEVSRQNGSLSLMLSTDRKQDSLQYDAKSAKFSLEPSTLEIFEVPHIDVADSRIVPDTGYVLINPDAMMNKLTGAELTANRFTKYHKFYDGAFTVLSRNNYYGNAEYEYIDKDNMAWMIHFEQIKVDTAGKTIGHAEILQEDDFYLSSFFAYTGRVELNAPERLMNFRGQLLIQHACEELKTDWFQFESVIDPKNIVVELPIDNPLTMGDDVFNGIYISPDSTSVYSGFLSKDRTRVDVEVISATGVLFYDETINSYIVTTRERLRDPEAPVNYVAFNNRNCVMLGKGRLKIGENTGRVVFESYGLVQHDLRSAELTLDVVMSVDFLFSDEISEFMSTDINAESSLTGVKTDREAYKIAMSFMIPDAEDRAEYYEELTSFGIPSTLPRSFRKTIFFSDLKLHWNPVHHSFVSVDDIGIGYINEVAVGKKVDGVMEIRRMRTGDEWYLYTKPYREYYYFQYRRNNMQFFSPNRDLTNIILQMEPKDRSISRDDENPAYNYNMTSRGRVNLFLRKHDREPDGRE